jgi:gentisate 1,2-dioxygenase
MSAVPNASRPDAALIAALEGANYHPLWDRYKRITPMAPAAKDVPMHWRWRDFEPLTARAAREVPIEDVERRAIIMVNPAFGGATTTTSNLIGAFTILNPGDRAVPHRRAVWLCRHPPADGLPSLGLTS